jgi:transcription elongation factor GreA
MDFNNNAIEEREFYFTKEGLMKAKKEYEDLKRIRLTKVKEDIPDVLESEDLNPEYILFKQDLDLIDQKIFELENILKNAKIIKMPPKNKRDIVDIGATVCVEIEGIKDEFTIVGSFEANPSLGKISNESVVGRALLGHKVGDEIIISSPVKTRYKIKKIKYLSLS